MLAPVLDPFDRAPEQPGRRHHRDVLGIDAELRPEAAADVRGGDAQPVVIEPDERGQRVEQIVRLLGRGPDRDGVVGAMEFGDDAAALDRMAGAAMLPQRLAHHVLCARERRRDVAVAHLVGSYDVGGELPAHRRRAGLRGLPAIRDRRQRLVIDLHQGGRILGHIAIVREHDRDRLAHIGHLAVRERKGPQFVERRPRIRAAHHPPLRQHRLEIVEGEHRMDARQCARGGGRDLSDQRVRMRAANESRVQHAAHRHIVDEAAASAQQRFVLETQDSRSDQGGHASFQVVLFHLSPSGQGRRAKRVGWGISD